MDSGVPDPGPPDSGIPDASVLTLTYDSTEAAGCESLRPQLSVPPSVASLREDPAAPCGLPYEADLHGRVIFGCWDSRPDGGPTYKLVESGGRLVRNLAGDVHVEDFIGYAARDGLIAIMDRPDAGEGAVFLANETVWNSTPAEPIGVAYDFEGQLLVVRSSAANQTWTRYDDLGTALTLVQPLPGILATFGFWALRSISSWPCPTLRAEILTADGTSCGSLRLREPDGSQRPFILTGAGTIIDGLQETLPDPDPPSGGLLRVSRWWPGVLRRP